MQKTFNLKNFMSKKAFYDDARGHMTALTRAYQNCYKIKCESGMSPQEAWQSCNEEYQKVGSDKSDWALKYVSAPDDKDVKVSGDLKTPFAKEIKK